MSNLRKAYEISLWRDVQDSNATFSEHRIAVIGSNQMTAQCRALSPKFKKGINGSKELTFKMYSKYHDILTGEEIENPFIELITNESKIKLKYRNKWYDFIVKNIQQDSSNSTVSYTATDLFINELSKNGYGLVMDTSLMNNMGSLEELSATVLQDTGWKATVVSSPKQYLAEQLVKLKNEKSQVVYAFYSSCREQPIRFQFATSLGVKNEDGIYFNPEQTYIDMRGKSYTTDTEATKYGFTYPVGYHFVELTQYRANRIVYTHKSKFNSTLNKIVYSYDDGKVEGYTTTEYISPNLIHNLITNNSFKSTDGWTGSYFLGADAPNNSGATHNAIVESVATAPDGSTLIDAFKNGSFNEANAKIYTPSLKVHLPTDSSVLINSGFYDNRNTIKNLAPGQKFVLLYKEKYGTQFLATIGVSEYQVKAGAYSNFDETFLVFDSSNSVAYNSNNSDFYGYRYVIAEVPDNYNIRNEKTFKNLKTQMFLYGGENRDYIFYDFQIFSYVSDEKNSGYPLLPENMAVEATTVTKYYYYKVEDNILNPTATGYRSTEQEYKYSSISDLPNETYSPDFTDGKINSINIKQSNYFNAIQTLCEKFEVWADFVINYDSIGRVLNKEICFYESITNPNLAGFRYGLNLKSSKRTIDSKSIVTKLIVPDNTNEFAPNGFCSIARAGANASGENYIYDFSYYYNFNLLNQDTLEDLLYHNTPDDNNPLQGYYHKISIINVQLNKLIDRYSALSTPLMQAEANKQVAESGRIAAIESFEDAAEAFLKATGYAHTDITSSDEEITNKRLEQINNSETLQNHLIKISEYYAAWQKYIDEAHKAEVQYDSYKKLNNELLREIESLGKQKEELNKLFYQSFYRFIQEGTWKSDEHTDNEKYYHDAFSTLKNSSVPRVNYTFGVLDLSQLEGYEDFDFELADKTWVEDPELFGDKHEEVVITEITYALEEPEQNSVKIQNYRNQFADLFQQVTATTQQVQYASGLWEKAAGFADADPVKQAAFLQNALTDAEMKLQNAGEQSVVWDKTGITVTDLDSPNQQLRIIGGAILLRDQDDDGLGWKVGITPKGISAKLLTAGQINTSVVSIMNGDEPYFRWDAFGISAYYFDTNNSEYYLNGLDTSKGVRFDRFGLYGYEGKDGTVWHPDTIQDVLDNSIFALTWDGLFLKLGSGVYAEGFDVTTGSIIPVFGENAIHRTTTTLGKAGKYLYNTWVDGYPSYDPKLSEANTFVKVFSIGDGEQNEQLVIYDDGTLVANNVRLTGGVYWAPDSSPARSVYGPIELANHKPHDKWYYKDIPDHDPGESVPKEERWHRIKSDNDVLYCHTDTAGAYWEGHFLITGRSIKETKTEYALEMKYVEPEQITKWDVNFPKDIYPNSYLFIRNYDIYEEGTTSSYRYSVSFNGETGAASYSVTSSNDSATISATVEGEIDLNALKKVTNVVITVWEGSGNISNECRYIWESEGGTLEKAEGRENCFVNMTEDNAIARVVIMKNDNTYVGEKSLSVSKIKQGGEATTCYLYSSLGNLFEEGSMETTTLIAYIYRGNIELDIDGDKFIYNWFSQSEDGQVTQLNYTGKEINIPISEIADKNIYFTADEI